MTQSNDTLRDLAVARARAKECLVRYAVAGTTILGFLTAIWALGDRNAFWPVWPAIALGFGLLMQTVPLLPVLRPERHRIERETDRLRSR